MKIISIIKQIPINKFSAGLLTVGIVTGVALTASQVSNTRPLDLGKKADASTGATTDPTTPTDQTSTPSAANDPTTANDPSIANQTPSSTSNTPSNTTNGVTQNSAGTTTISQSQASQTVPVAPTLTGTTQRSQPGSDPDTTEYYCDYSWSDGTTTSKFSGSASNADIAKFGVTFGCPSAT